MGISLHRGPVGERGGESIYWELWDIVEGGLWKWSKSVCGSLIRQTWRRGSFAGDPEDYVKEGSGDRHLCSWGPHWGTWKGAHLPGTLTDGWRRGSESGASLWGEPGGRAPLLRIPKDMLSKDLEMGVCSHRGPAFGEHGGTLLL